MTNQHPLTERIPLNHYPYEKTMISPLDKACDDQRDAFQESISEAHKLGLKTGRDAQLEQVIEWLKFGYQTDPNLSEERKRIGGFMEIAIALEQAMRPTNTQEED